jgi:hypothetical protein
MFKLPPGDAERRIEIRQLRQNQLLTRDPPLTLSVIIDESVLRRRFGDNKVMRDQLLRLEEASWQPNVDLRVLPLDGAHPIGTGAFSYLHFDTVHDVPLGNMVEVEHLTGSYYLDDEDRTYRYQETFDSLSAASSDPDRSRLMISETCQAHWV